MADAGQEAGIYPWITPILPPTSAIICCLVYIIVDQIEMR